MLFLSFNFLVFSAGSLKILSMGIYTFSKDSELEYWCAQKVIERHHSFAVCNALKKAMERLLE